MRKLVPVLGAVLVFVAGFLLANVLQSSESGASVITAPNGQAMIQILDDDLEDDSVRAALYDISLSQDEAGQRSVSDQSSTRQCHAGRGHQDFSTERCH